MTENTTSTLAPQEPRDLLRSALEMAYPNWVSVSQLHARTDVPRPTIYLWAKNQIARKKVVRTESSGIFYYRLNR